MTFRLAPLLLSLFILAAITGCGGSWNPAPSRDTTTPNTPAPPATPSPPAILTGILIDHPNPNLFAGRVEKFTATGQYSDGTTRDVTSSVTWTSLIPSVALISTNGHAVGISNGTALLQASLGGFSSTSFLSIDCCTLQSVSVTGANQRVAQGGQKHLAAIGTTDNGDMGDISPVVSWSSSNSAVATINDRGMITGVTSGSTTISASLGNIPTATFPLTVAPLPTLDLFAGNMNGQGSLDATGADARFGNFLMDLVTDTTGNIYAVDASSHTIRKITPAGVVTTLAGSAGQLGNADGLGSAARFNYPGGITIDTTGNLYVSDSANNTIRKITPNGQVSTLAGRGTPGGVDGTGIFAAFNAPKGIAFMGGNLYVADALNNTIRQVTLAGAVSTFAGTGTSGGTDGPVATAQFNFPRGITADIAGNLYITDSNNVLIGGSFTVRKIDSAGIVSTLIGAAANFAAAEGITTDASGNVYVVDTYNQSIKKITPAGVMTVFAGGSIVWGSQLWGSTDGTGAVARFRNPWGITTDSTGNMYVADSLNFSIRKITPAGVVSTFVGSPELIGRTDGFGATARFYHPQGLSADAEGTLYVADSLNSVIRKVSAAGMVTILAGGTSNTGTTGSADGIGVNAQFSTPFALTADMTGNVYVADTGNSTIRKITPAGVVTTLAGSPGLRQWANGNGALARFDMPHGIVSDSADNLFVADTERSPI